MGNEAVLQDIVLGLTGDRKMDAVYLFSLIPGINEGTTF